MRSNPFQAFFLVFALGFAPSVGAQAPCASRVHTEPGRLSGSLPLQTRIYSYTGASESRSLALAARRFDPALGTLRCVLVRFDLSDGMRHDGGLFAAPSIAVGLNANVRVTERLSPPGASPIVFNFFHNQSITLRPQDMWWNFTIPYPVQNATGSTGLITAPSALAQYTGSGNISIPLQCTYVQEVTSTGAGQGAFTALPDITATIEYGYDPHASVLSYGTGCVGTGGLSPAIGASSLPVVGNAGFAVTLSQARPTSAAALHLGVGPDNVPLGGGCFLLVQGPLVFLPSVATDASGAASTPVPIPADPSLYGQTVHGQYSVVDPLSPIGTLVFSDGLAMLLGT
ncbi:MAG: choice-of-anchor E domain-containing protein [Planctomycetes bacterium]|nr:choice-of-anchor E domain-containing protein [Planctomycetota bacterium]